MLYGFTLSLALTTTALSTGTRLGNDVGDELDELFVSDTSVIASLATADDDIGPHSGHWSLVSHWNCSKLVSDWK